MEICSTHPISEKDMIGLRKRVAREFKELFANFDFSYEFQIMQIKPFQLRLRKNLKKEFQCFYVALWHLALQRSFPNDYEEIFSLFLIDFAQKDTDRANKIEHINAYVEKLNSPSDNSFSHIAMHFLSFTTHEDKILPTITLKIALHLRKVYTFIFEKLY